MTTWLALDAAAQATGRGVAALGALATVILAVGLLLRLPGAVGVAAAVLGGAYTLEVVVEDARLDRGAPLVGVLLLLVCELGFWSHELRTTSPDEAGARARHVAWLCALGLGTLAAAAALEVTAELARVEGLAVDVLGSLAAVGALALLARLAISAGLAPRRGRGPHTEPERAGEAPWRGA